ncbi:hypothetical protein [Pseudochrobactrum sp. XF203]|uniref:hypothetical protein n=1 Tax=Pseudochrobactrum sp. XF203 TaxID=2879116 RepID=UPI001CE35233|nr:hypothetical protein [Pseudochrobactrum sp. XF203]UCA46161.1 hypothetical protein LDL70_02555 [Pseudochrobactrum sp. XF203]
MSSHNEEHKFSDIFSDTSDLRDEQIAELQERLTAEKDARNEERFIFIAVTVILLNVVFFSVMPSFGGPIALLILELLVLIPLASRLGMEEVKQILSRALDRVASNAQDPSDSG